MAEAYKSETNQKILDKVLGMKREAYSKLDQALNLDASKQYNEAIVLYRKCIQLLNTAIEFIKTQNIDLNKSNEINKVDQDLHILLKQTIDRLELLENDLKKSQKSSAIASLSSSSVANVDDFLLIGDEILNDSFEESNVNNQSVKLIETNVESNDSNATEVYRVDNGVQLFYIAADGSVSTPSYPNTLTIYSFNDPKDSLAKGFIRVGNWFYPLTPDKTPTMRTNYNAYIFPNSDVNTDEANSNRINCPFIGIMFTDSVDENVKCLFEDVLGNFSSLIQQQESAQQVSQARALPQLQQAGSKVINSDAPFKLQELVSSDEDVIFLGEKKIDEKEKEEEEGEENEPINTTERISKGLIDGAKYLSQGVAKATVFADKYIKIGGEKIKTQIVPSEVETKVDPKLQKAMAGVRYGTHVTVRVSSFLVDKLGLLASKAAKTMTPYIKSGSSKLLTQTGIVKSSENANNYLENVCTVASSSMIGFSLLYESLEGAAKSLANNLAQESVQVVQHKYGDDASKITENALYSVGNVALTANNVRNLKITKTIAKETAKETLKSFSNQNLQELQNNQIDNNQKNETTKQVKKA